MLDTVESKSTTNAVFDVLGPQLEFLTPVSALRDDRYCVIRATIPPGVIVPLHSHVDRETVFMLSGSLEAFKDDAWRTLKKGDVFDVYSDVRHAFRNRSAEPVSLIKVTTTNMARFLLHVGEPIALAAGGVTPERVERFQNAVRDFGYWVAGPADNIADRHLGL